MDIKSTHFVGDMVEIVLSDGKEDGEQIVVRMRTELDATERLAGHQLASLRAAREAIVAETQRLQVLLDPYD